MFAILPDSHSLVGRSDTKELRFRPNTEEHDYNVRLKNAKKHLSKVSDCTSCRVQEVLHCVVMRSKIIHLGFSQDLERGQQVVERQCNLSLYPDASMSVINLKLRGTCWVTLHEPKHRTSM